MHLQLFDVAGGGHGGGDTVVTVNVRHYNYNIITLYKCNHNGGDAIVTDYVQLYISIINIMYMPAAAPYSYRGRQTRGTSYSIESRRVISCHGLVDIPRGGHELDDTITIILEYMYIYYNDVLYASGTVLMLRVADTSGMIL
jgi:hypothetical protein